MPSFNEYIAHGNAWLFFPMAIFLGALHGLEPGHSKTMMSFFIIGIRGTVWQAFLLGISAFSSGFCSLYGSILNDLGLSRPLTPLENASKSFRISLKIFLLTHKTF